MKLSLKINSVLLRDFRIKANRYKENFCKAEQIFKKLSIIGGADVGSDPFLIMALRYEVLGTLMFLLERLNTFSCIKNSYPDSSILLCSDSRIDKLAYNYVIHGYRTNSSKPKIKKMKTKCYMFKILFKKIFLSFTTGTGGEKYPFVLFNFAERCDKFIKEVIGDSKIKIIDDLTVFSFSISKSSILSYVRFSYILKLLLQKNRYSIQIKDNSDPAIEKYAYIVEDVLHVKHITIDIYSQLIRINGIRHLECEIGNAIVMINSCIGKYAYYLNKNRIISYCLFSVLEVLRMTGSIVRVDKLFVHSIIEKEYLKNEGISEEKIVPIGFMGEKKKAVSPVSNRIVIFSTYFRDMEAWGIYEEDWLVIEKNIHRLVSANPEFHFIIKLHPYEIGENRWKDFVKEYSNVEIIHDGDVFELIQSSFFSINFNSTTSFYSTLARKITITVLPSKMLDLDGFQLIRFKTQLFLTDSSKLSVCFAKVVSNQRLRDFLLKRMEIFCNHYNEFDKDRFFKEIYGEKHKEAV